MKEYHDVLKHVLAHGRPTASGAVLASTGSNVGTFAVFGHQMRVNLAAGFPLLTTKRMSFKVVAHELAWFLSGSTSVRPLQAAGVTIWDEWADPDGELGPVYGAQWRSFGGLDAAGDPRSVDQIAVAEAQVRECLEDPHARARRRIVVSAWNPPQVPAMRLPPCHTLFQLNVRPDRTLDCHLYARSIDAFLGLPYNVASYALLVEVFSHATGALPGDLVISFGDLHLYSNHLDEAREQLSREPHPRPRLEWLRPLASVTDFRPEDVRLEGYRCRSAIRAEVAI